MRFMFGMLVGGLLVYSSPELQLTLGQLLNRHSYTYHDYYSVPSYPGLYTLPRVKRDPCDIKWRDWGSTDPICV